MIHSVIGGAGSVGSLPSRPSHHRFGHYALFIRLRVLVDHSVSPGRIGRSPESRYPVHEQFHLVPPWFWNSPALYVTGHSTGKRDWGRMEKSMGASQETYCRKEARDGTRSRYLIQ